MSIIGGTQVGDQCYIGNQGTVRVATVTQLMRSRVTVRWKNTVRRMERDVAICMSEADWIKGNTSNKMLPRFICSPAQQAVLDTEPRIQSIITLLAPEAS